MTDYQREAWESIVGEHHPFGLLQWGRGTGKTKFGAQRILHLVNTYKDLRIVIAAPTHRDLRDTIVNGESGLMATFPEHQRPKYKSSTATVDFINGNQALLIPASEPERFRGINAHFAWCDELGSWLYPDAYTNLKLGLRLEFPDGNDPQLLITTTPQPSTLMKQIAGHRNVKAFYAATNRNPHLPKRVRDEYEEEFGGTTLGRQELFGELLDDVEGALWSVQQIAACALRDVPEDEWLYTAIGIDPAGNSATSDLTGIVVVSLRKDNHFVVRADHSGKYSPEQLYNQLCLLHEKYDADGCWVETNYGGEFLKASLPTHIPITFKASTKDKARRALPVVQQYERNIVHHAPGLGDLEKQMYSWSPQDSTAKSPDRMDGLVFAFSWILAKHKTKVRVWA